MWETLFALMMISFPPNTRKHQVTILNIKTSICNEKGAWN